ncbi:hypothetical protein [Bdellovibrio svalbardensis]|uniref:Uncharacterized protein n=1 Tax=Bdellovibrio svalbardensis TaxID=2972972 RepID=A0ABT6DMJ1_9BACT|nr:hypothetical protein [Bdellovibrio svalbardensis]MDG0817310.1 hypothetical protein [Bdellovibrio svalbardensis]
MRKIILMILAGAMMAQSVHAQVGHHPNRGVASQGQMSSAARDALVAIENQTESIISSGKSEVSAQDLQALSAVTAGLSAEQRLEVLDAVIYRLHQIRYGIELKSSGESTKGGALVVFSVIAGCLSAMMFIHEDAAKPSPLRWIGVAVTASSIGGLGYMMATDDDEVTHMRQIADDLMIALVRAKDATEYQIQAEGLK